MAFKDKAQKTRYKNEFARANYDRIVVQVVKGGKADIKAAADRDGISVNAWINEAIDEKMKNKR